MGFVVCVCVRVDFVMCRCVFCNVWGCVCMSGFCNLWVCVLKCVGVCVYVWVL